MSIEQNLKKLGIVLPEAPAPVGSYVAFKKVGNFLFISGQISLEGNGNLIKGKVGSEINLDEGKRAAEACCINIISQLNKACNDLTRDNCLATSCCVYAKIEDNESCYAGGEDGPTFKRDENGKTKDIDFYWYKNKCYGKNCEKKE